MHIKKILGVAVRVLFYTGTFVTLINKYRKRTQVQQDTIHKLDSYYRIMDQWLKNKSNQRSISTYLLDNDIRSIAIYGLGPLGQNVFFELRDKDINIVCFIDKNTSDMEESFEGIPIVNLQKAKINVKGKADAIIITPSFFYEGICEDLFKIGIDDVELIPLDDIIYQICYAK